MELGVGACLLTPVLLLAVTVTPEAYNLAATVVGVAIGAVGLMEPEHYLSFLRFLGLTDDALSELGRRQTESMTDGSIVEISQIVVLELTSTLTET